MEDRVLSPEEIEKAFNALLKLTRKAKEIVQNLDGKTSYVDLSKRIGLSATTVSSVQTESWKLGLSTKNGSLYKIKRGIMKYAPNVRGLKKRYVSYENEIKKIKISRMVAPTKNPKLIGLRIQEANNMAKPYQWLFITENALRDLIRKVLGETNTWWRQKCPSDFMQLISDKKNSPHYNDSERKDELECCELDHLKKIISKNWNEFGDYFYVDKEKFNHQFESSLPTRNSIGHCISLHGLEMEEVPVRFNDILKMIK